MDEEKQREFQNKERHLGNLNREIDLASKQLPDITNREVMLGTEKDLLNKQMTLALRDFKIIKPTWEFETKDDYVEVLKELNKLNHDKKMIEFDILAARLKEQTAAVTAQLESLLKEKERITQWLLDNKEEGDTDGTK